MRQKSERISFDKLFVFDPKKEIENFKNDNFISYYIVKMLTLDICELVDHICNHYGKSKRVRKMLEDNVLDICCFLAHVKDLDAVKYHHLPIIYKHLMSKGLNESMRNDNCYISLKYLIKEH